MEDKKILAVILMLLALASIYFLFTKSKKKQKKQIENNLASKNNDVDKYKLSSEKEDKTEKTSTSETKKGILWEYVCFTFIIAFLYISFSNNSSSRGSNYGNLTLTTAAFIGQFIGTLLIPSITAVICSYLIKGYKFEQILFFCALFFYVISGIAISLNI